MTQNSKEPLILAIDLGTSSVKVALVSVSGEVIALDGENIGLILLANGGAEQNPHEWWSAIRSATRRLLGRERENARRVVAVSCTAQWSGTVAIARDGKPLGNAIIWMDSRGAPYVKRAADGILHIRGYGLGKLVRWLRLTGGVPARSGKDSLAHILFIKHERPERYHETKTFLEPKDYLNLVLTGEHAASYDSIALHWLTDNRNLTRVSYDSRLISFVHIDREKLPRLEPATHVIGTLKRNVAEELGLSPNVKVVVGSPDVQAAAIGSGAVEDYVGHLYLGTSSWITCHVPKKKTDLWNNMTTLPSAIPGRYFVADEQECAGACLVFLRNLLLPQNDMGDSNAYRLLDTIAESAPAGSKGVVFTPWLYGERTPVENPTIRGGFHNVSLTTERKDLVRATYEGVALNSRWLLGCVESFTERRMNEIRAIGGGASSDIWCQIHADVLGRQILQVCDSAHANARGAAFIGAIALGYLTFSEIPPLVKIKNVFSPSRITRPLYDELFLAFRDIYKRHRKICERLNTLKKEDGNGRK